jgi:hypothetical protein
MQQKLNAACEVEWNPDVQAFYQTGRCLDRTFCSAEESPSSLCTVGVFVPRSQVDALTSCSPPPEPTTYIRKDSRCEDPVAFESR